MLDGVQATRYCRILTMEGANRHWPKETCVLGWSRKPSNVLGEETQTRETWGPEAIDSLIRFLPTADGSQFAALKREWLRGRLEPEGLYAYHWGSSFRV